MTALLDLVRQQMRNTVLVILWGLLGGFLGFYLGIIPGAFIFPVMGSSPGLFVFCSATSILAACFSMRLFYKGKLWGLRSEDKK